MYQYTEKTNNNIFCNFFQAFDIQIYVYFVYAEIRNIVLSDYEASFFLSQNRFGFVIKFPLILLLAN